jgi:hypothetical protein
LRTGNTVSVVLDTDALTRLAKTLARAQFEARITGFYIAITMPEPETETNEPTPAAVYNTEVQSRAVLMAQVAMLDDDDDTDDPSFRVVPVAKTAGNPYRDRISVGRARGCDIVIRDASVSKLHAHFRPTDDGKMQLVDLESSNGTRVDRRVLRANEQVSVTTGARIVFGNVTTQLLDAKALYDLLK